MRNKNNRGWYGFFSILAYSISTLASITFVWELHISKLEITQLMATCILFMAGAWFTLKEAFSVRKIAESLLPDDTIEQNISYKHQGLSRFCYIGLYAICTIFSIFTTANMALEAINRDNDVKIKSSDTYKNIQASSASAQANIDTNNKYIDSLVEEKRKAYNAQLSQVDKWKEIRVKERRLEMQRADAIADKYDKKIEKARAENISFQKDITTAISPVDASVSAKQKSLIEMLPFDVDKLIVVVILIMGVGVDLLGAFFTVQYAKETYFYYHGHSSTPSTTPPTNEPETHGSLSTSRKGASWFKRKKSGSVAGTMAKNVVPFEKKSTSTNNVHVDEKRPSLTSASFQEFTKDEIKAYLNEMYKTRKKNGDSIGFVKIGENIGIDKKKAEKIKAHLEMLGVVKSVQNRTMILKEAQ